MKKLTLFTIISLLLAISFISSCTDDENEEESVTTETGAGIYGVITDEATGEPINAAGVGLYLCTEWSPESLLYKGREYITSTVTGSEGQYEFTNLEAGTYVINVTKTGYIDIDNTSWYAINYAPYYGTLTLWEVESGKTFKGDVQIEKQPAVLRIVDDNGIEISSLSFGSSESDVTRLFNIFNDSSESIEWEIITNASWISSVSKTSGTLTAGKTQGIVITIDRNELLVGENTTTIHITSSNGNKAITLSATK